MKYSGLLSKLNIEKSDYDYITKNLQREPNELELYLFSAMYSEHCAYRHSKKYLKKLYNKKAVYVNENAGGIRLGKHIICFKMESHNHPSAVEPYNGAATGVGGIIRDVLAMNARPILLADSLKFGNLDSRKSKYLFENVVRGISAYGNCTGIPTIAGETDFDCAYQTNPLVNVMALGIVKHDKIKTSKTSPGKLIVLVGSRTMKDGIGGAAFASKVLADNFDENRISVQIADPFMKKKLIEATLEILDKNLADACQDCGAAGILSSTSELAAKSGCGIFLDLDKVHLGDTSMNLAQIMLSETQERMVFAADKNNLGQIRLIAQKYELELSVIGRTIEEKRYQLSSKSQLRADLPVDVLTNPPALKPKSQKRSIFTLFSFEKKAPKNHLFSVGPKHARKNKLTKNIYEFIKDPCFASKEWVYSQYDYSVGNRTVIAPGQKGCSALWLYEEDCFLGVAVESQPLCAKIDSYNAAVNTIYDAARKLIASGFEPAGYTNCLNFANPQNPQVFSQFEKTIKGFARASKKLKIPAVSGNVSFYNECEGTAVLPTPTVAMIGICKDFNSIRSSSFTQKDKVILIGKKINNRSKIGGSLYYKKFYDGFEDCIDKTDFKTEKKLKKAIQELNKKKCLNSCINVGKGGLFGALFKGLIKDELGFAGMFFEQIDLEKLLFGEIGGQYLISTQDFGAAEKILRGKNVPYMVLGECNSGDNIEFADISIDKKAAFASYKEAVSDIMKPKHAAFAAQQETKAQQETCASLRNSRTL